jgi:hypothetical protein
MQFYLLGALGSSFILLVLCVLRATPLEFSDLTSRDLLEPTVTCIGTNNPDYGILLVGE